MTTSCADLPPRQPSTLPPRVGLPPGATREEVRAWLELEERRDTEYGNREHTFPEVKIGHRGCVSCDCGDVLAYYGGPSTPNLSLEAQHRAGEEDQSQPGWDQGA